MLTKEQEAEYWAMHYYLGGDCNCCEHMSDCNFFESLQFPSKENCMWKFSTALVRETEKISNTEEEHK